MQQYTTAETSVLLSGGTQTLRLYTAGASFTVNRLEIVTPPGTNNYALQLNNHPVNGGGFISDAVNDFTVEFWIKAAGTHQIDVESNSLSNIEGVAGQRYAMFPVHGYGSGDAGMGVSVGTNGVSVYEHADGYMPPLLVWESPTPLADWTHVAIVYRNKQPSLYINGNWVKDGQVSQKNNVYAGLQFPGGHYGGTGGEQMDEVRVWKYARTEQQIRDNRQGEIPGTTPGLAGYWPMNEGSGTVLHDISGNGRDIDLSSAGYNNSNWVSGRYTISNQEDLYRYAFNSKERDQDIGEDNYDYGMRIHDARLGRFLSVDPLQKKYPELTPYQFAANRPIDGIDLDGLEWATYTYRTYKDANGRTHVQINRQSYDNWYPGTQLWLKPQGAAPNQYANQGIAFGSFQELKEAAAKFGFGQADFDANYKAFDDARWRMFKVIAITHISSEAINATDAYVGSKIAPKTMPSISSAESTETAGTRPIEQTNKQASGVHGGKKNFSVSNRKVNFENHGSEFLDGDLRMKEQPLDPGPKSFKDLVKNPKAIWGKSASEVEKILGPGWKKAPLNSGEGWKFTSTGDGGFVSYTTGNSHHPNSEYYKINSGVSGKVKVVGDGYVSTPSDKAKIIKAN